MIIESEKREWLLRCPLSTSPRRSVLRRITAARDFLPDNSCFFSPTACHVAAALSMSADDEMYGTFSQTLFDLTFFSSRC